MSDLEEIEEAMNEAKLDGCRSCYKSIGGRAAPRTDDRHDDSCWQCRRLSNWEWEGFRNVKTWMTTKDGLREIHNSIGDLELGQDPITKHVRPIWTQWRPSTVHKDIKAQARKRRRVFKQYLKTGSLRLLQAAERKITSWDFD